MPSASRREYHGPMMGCLIYVPNFRIPLDHKTYFPELWQWSSYHIIVSKGRTGEDR
jgi:hypothetical protein